MPPPPLAAPQAIIYFIIDHLIFYLLSIFYLLIASCARFAHVPQTPMVCTKLCVPLSWFRFLFLTATIITIDNLFTYWKNMIYESKDLGRLSFASRKKFKHCLLNYKVLDTNYCSVVIRELEKLFFSFSIVTPNKYRRWLSKTSREKTAQATSPKRCLAKYWAIYRLRYLLRLFVCTTLSQDISKFQNM